MKILKKSLIALASVVLSVSMLGMTASADMETEETGGSNLDSDVIDVYDVNSTTSDSYSVFTWNRSGTTATVSITNTSGAARCGVVNAYGYDTSGNYVAHITSQQNNLADNGKLSKSGQIAGASSMVFHGYLYSSTSATGTPLSSWTRSA